MAMSDCIKCWETPCSCGYDYRHKTKQTRIELAAVILGVEERDLEKLLDGIIPEKHPMHDEK
jgi:hypothetical protein